MELRHLKYFLAVCETENVTRAARQCFVAQSALSAQIAWLEADLGSVLFTRQSRGMQLTPAGRALRPLAQRILADVAHAREQLAALEGVLTGQLRLGTIQGPPPNYDLVNLMAVFHSRYPGVELSLSTGASDTLAADVASGALDLAVVAKLHNLPSQLTASRRVDDPLMAVLAANVPWEGGSISAAQLTDLGPFIGYRAGSGLRHSVEATFQRAGISVDPRFELDQFSDMLRLAGAGVGVTMLPNSVFHDAGPISAELHVTPIADPKALHTVGVVLPSAPSPAARALLALIDEQNSTSI